MPSTEFHSMEQTVEPAQAATVTSPDSPALELPELPRLPKMTIESAPEPMGMKQTVAREEHIPQAQNLEMQSNENVQALSSQAYAADPAHQVCAGEIIEIAPIRAGAGDLRKLGGLAKDSPVRAQAIEEERRAIVAAIRECAKKLGTTPSFDRMRSMAGVSMHRIQRHFGGYNAALGACGLELHGNARPRSMEELFQDWAEIVRKLGRVPTRAQYGTHSRNSSRPLLHRFQMWSAIPAGMRQYAQERGLQSEWKDVLGITEGHLKGIANGRPIGTFSVSEKPPETPKRTSLGDPLTHLPMMHAPTCENAVLFLFGAMANDLGFKVRRMQAAFPDCLAVRRVGENQWEDVKIEMELFSRNFAAHGHDPKGCNLIVCWEHNWPECPLEVLELKSRLP